MLRRRPGRQLAVWVAYPGQRAAAIGEQWQQPVEIEQTEGIRHGPAGAERAYPCPVLDCPVVRLDDRTECAGVHRADMGEVDGNMTLWMHGGAEDVVQAGGTGRRRGEFTLTGGCGRAAAST